MFCSTYGSPRGYKAPLQPLEIFVQSKMKTIQASFLLLLLCAAMVSANSDPTVDDAGGFVASFPGPIKKQDLNQNGPFGQVVMHQTSCASIQDTVFVAEYVDVPNPIAPEKVANMYTKQAQASAAAMKGQLRTQAPCKLGDVAGTEFIVDIASSQIVIRTRIFLVGTRVFTLMCAVPSGNETSKPVEDFLNSFRLLR
jgi:hypothetical protein